MEIRNAEEADFDRILALNLAEVRQTSPMDRERLRLLHGLACYHKVAIVDRQVGAFLIAMREGAAYENENYAWFAARFEKFIYIDRIIVASELAGGGIGAIMYRHLFDFARSLGVDHITCEYNIEPPNPASRIFHDRFGFTELDTRLVGDGSKRVSMQVAET
ncbi:MAG TPA: GNAT family N-acetyltransferase [Dokdonella sp.]|jgi:uncharacterized protein|nr:GNAT family N-acetyltransferase [Dokdonella sp.]